MASKFATLFPLRDGVSVPPPRRGGAVAASSSTGRAEGPQDPGSARQRSAMPSPRAGSVGRLPLGAWPRPGEPQATRRGREQMLTLGTPPVPARSRQGPRRHPTGAKPPQILALRAPWARLNYVPQQRPGWYASQDRRPHPPHGPLLTDRGLMASHLNDLQLVCSLFLKEFIFIYF